MGNGQGLLGFGAAVCSGVWVAGCVRMSADRSIRHSVPLERFKMNKIHYRKHKAWAAEAIKTEDREWHEMQARLCLDSCRTWRAHQHWKTRTGASTQ
tara:strand:- start:2748 stop:3038 length:291 start_codon:yes stop_codon:yes gene_type:complete